MSLDLQEERRQLMEQVLDIYDPDNEGHVQTKDSTKILKAMGRTLNDGDELNFREMADPDNTGVISKKKFLETFESLFSLPNESVNELYEAFRVFDVNNTGKISVKNFKNVLVNIGEEFNEQEVDDILKYIDVDRDGNINIRDFIEVWKLQ